MQILDGQSLAELGTLVAGLNSSTLRRVAPEVVLEAIQLPAFAQHIGPLPSALKTILVEKVILFYLLKGAGMGALGHLCHSCTPSQHSLLDLSQPGRVKS